MSVFVLSPYINGILDIRWDNPALIPENSAFQIVGVNIYRSFDSEGGPYTKVNPTPLGAGLYRDSTTAVLITDEVVTNLQRGLNPQKEWRFKTTFFPMVQPGTTVPKPALRSDIVVKVNNGDNVLMEVPFLRFDPDTGEIVLISTGILDPATQKIIDPRLPANIPGAITVSYYVNSNKIRSDLNNRVFYKLTTVGVNSDGQVVESDLRITKPVNLYQQEKTDWMWKEAIRRNRWILEQGGERVKVFIRKWNGEICPKHDQFAENSVYDCKICFGTNYVGGYEGPFDIIIAPPDAEKNVELNETGLRVNYNWQTWTGPSPMMNKRDLIIRPTGERFTVGSINYVGQRGAIFQQMFSLQQLDSKDFLYELGISGGASAPAEPFDTRSERTSDASPTIPDNKPTNRNYPLEKGRTPTFEDIMY
jgi:hypothetical protein